MTITPASARAVAPAGRRTHFVASVRILVNDANYRYWIRGPRGCGITSGIGGGGGPLDIHGQRLTILLATPDGAGGAWAPTT